MGTRLLGKKRPHPSAAEETAPAATLVTQVVQGSPSARPRAPKKARIAVPAVSHSSPPPPPMSKREIRPTQKVKATAVAAPRRSARVTQRGQAVDLSDEVAESDGDGAEGQEDEWEEEIGRAHV